MKNILAFDVGTTSMKCILFDELFNELCREQTEYDIESGPDSFAVLDAQCYYDAFCDCVTALQKKGFDTSKIDAICFTTQGETLIPVNKKGEPLSKAIVWLDARAGEEAAFISERLGNEKIYETTGLPEIDGALPMAKVLWIKRKACELYRKTHKFLLLEDFLIYKLTGKFVSEKSLQSSTGWYDIKNEKLFDEVLELCEIDAEKFPRILSCGEAIGKVSQEVAQKLGFDKNTVVVTGAMDQIASAIGAGNICEGIVTETTGTALVLGATVETPDFNIEEPLTIYKHFDSNYIYMPYFPTAGIVLKWFRDTIVPYVNKQASEEGVSSYQLIDEIAMKSPAGSNGVIMKPDFTNGGSFEGLTLSATINDLSRSVLEGVAYLLRELVEGLEKKGVCIEEIFSLGGGAYSELWCGIKASVCGRKISSVRYNQTTALGAAVLASVAIGCYDSVQQAVSQINHQRKTYNPDKGEEKIYEENYYKFRR